MALRRAKLADFGFPTTFKVKLTFRKFKVINWQVLVPQITEKIIICQYAIESTQYVIDSILTEDS